MKKSYQHIIKKSYTTPKIEEVEIDVAISLSEISTPIPEDPDEEGGGGGGGGIGEGPPVADGQDISTAPKYHTEYRSESPFGGSRPVY